MAKKTILIEKEVGENCHSCSYRNSTECQLFVDTLFTRTKDGKLQYQQLDACKEAQAKAEAFREQR